ncbi:sericin 1 precursor-like protein [Synechococcus phage S-MbCM6]|jgi:hypothetical protein|uniref:Sericin 1-like protein n=2 Tax=Namakavirus smbcm6 TaxID=2734120 RepID=H8ZMD9_9CAUD|nr:sericin 1 precursor-like protein [Synechococcus phage ACG-2014c]AFD02650.1 sericin 1 precursor-like protein [Synechococcus phage ACG-2014c]AIX14427.1 sericin 1 precursor-like protein [Synechococcus phage ACG-2014c]
MSQINTDAIRNQAGEGQGIDIANGGNISFNTDTLYVDATNDRVGFGTTLPQAKLHMIGGFGLNANTAPIIEGINIVTDSINGSPNIRVDTDGPSHIFTTASTGNFTINIGTGTNAGTDLSSVMDVGQYISVTAIVSLGASSGFCNTINLGGAANTTYWVGGEVPDEVGDTSGYDIYYIQIHRNAASTYYVLAGKGHYSS